MWTPWLFLVIVVKNKQCHLLIESIATILNLKIKHWHIHLHLSVAFIQSDLQCIQAIHLSCQYVCSLGIKPTIFALLTQCSNHWATGTLYIYIYIYTHTYTHTQCTVHFCFCVFLFRRERTADPTGSAWGCWEIYLPGCEWSWRGQNALWPGGVG